MPSPQSEEVPAFLSMEPFYPFARSETARLMVQFHQALTQAPPLPHDAPDILARLVDLDADTATHLGELGTRAIAASDPEAARRLLDALGTTHIHEVRHALRIVRAHSHVERAAGGSGLPILQAAVDEGPEGDGAEWAHILAHTLGDYAAVAEDEEAGRLALDVVGRIPREEGRDDTKGRVVRRLAMRNDMDPTTRPLLALADEALPGLDDGWESYFTAIRLGLAHHLLGQPAAARERWAAIAQELPSEAPLGLPGAVHYGSLFQARVMAGEREEAQPMLAVLEAEFHQATREFTAALMEGDEVDEDKLSAEVLERTDVAHARMTTAAQSVVMAGQFGEDAALLRRADRWLSDLPSARPMAGTWRLLAESAYALDEQRLGHAAWRTAILATGHGVREAGAALRQVVSAELGIAHVTGDAEHVVSAARRLRQARGTAEDKEKAVADVLASDLQMRLEAADGVTYFYE